MYCVLAGIERFIVEFFRAKDDRFFVGGLTYAQVIAMGFVVFGVVWMMLARRSGAPGIYREARSHATGVDSVDARRGIALDCV